MFDRITVNIFGCIPKPKPRVRFGFKIGTPQIKRKVNGMLELTITNEEKITVTLTPVTSTGKPAKLDGKPTWEVISGDSTVEVSEDGLTATLISADDPGDTQFLVKGDADLGDGIQEVSDTVKLTVAGARAQNLGLTAGTPVPK